MTYRAWYDLLLAGVGAYCFGGALAWGGWFVSLFILGFIVYLVFDMYTESIVKQVKKESAKKDSST